MTTPISTFVLPTVDRTQLGSPVGSLQTGQASTGPVSSQAGDQVKASALDTPVTASPTAPELVPPSVTMTPETTALVTEFLNAMGLTDSDDQTAQASDLVESLAAKSQSGELATTDQVIAFLNERGLAPTDEQASQILQLLQMLNTPDAPEANDPSSDPLYGLSKEVNKSNAVFAALMAVIMDLMRSAVVMRNKSTETYFKANQETAKNQRSEGVASLWGAIAGGALNVAISGAGAARTMKGARTEMAAAERQSQNAAGGILHNPDQIQRDLQLGKADQAWGETMQRSGAPTMSNLMQGGAELDKANHTQDATEATGTATVANNAADQQTQQVSSNNALVQKMLELMAQYNQTTKQTMSAIAGNFGRV